MRILSLKPLFATALLVIGTASKAQDSTKLDKLISLPAKFFGSVDKKTRGLEVKLIKQTNKYLNKLQKQEHTLKQKLWKKDSILAKEMFENIDEKYDQLRRFKENSNQGQTTYSGHLDSLLTALNFLKSQNISNPDLEKAVAQLKEFQGKLSLSEEARRHLLQRQQYLKEQFQNFGMLKELKKFKKHVYYYQDQINEYKSIFENPKKLEAKLMQAITGLPAFKNFFASNSQIGSLFRVPASGNISNVSFSGLQTRYSVQQLVASRINVNPSQFVQTQLDNSNEKISANKQSLALPSLKKQNELGFKPNSQKSKSFKKRLEKGANVHFGKTNKFLPTSADLAVSLGYKLNDNGIIGVSSSYKLGLGSGISNIRISHQGYTLRSFVDWRLKGSLYIYGGFEKIYLPGLRHISGSLQQWQESGLLGVSKKYSLNNKIKGNMQFLYDFLGHKAIPSRERFVFRVGYNF